MSRVKEEAIRALEFNQLPIELLLLQLSSNPHTSKQLVDEHGDQWTFIARRRCRLFLMAKRPEMKRYEEIVVTSK